MVVGAARSHPGIRERREKRESGGGGEGKGKEKWKKEEGGGGGGRRSVALPRESRERSARGVIKG